MREREAPQVEPFILVGPMQLRSSRRTTLLSSSLAIGLTVLPLVGAVACSEKKATTTPPPAAAIKILAGHPGGPGTLDGKGQDARFAFPTGIVRDAAGNFIIVDQTAATLRKVTPAMEVTLYAGAPNESGFIDGERTVARFKNPSSIVADAAGNFFVTDMDNHVIRKITPDGTVSTFAGKAGEAGNNDGTGENARFRSPDGITIDGAGNLYVVDLETSVVRRITPQGEVKTYAGSTEESGHVDGDLETARFLFPKGIVSDAEGNLWIADTGSSTIRHITKAGVVSTIAGNPDLSGTDDGAGSAATFNGPRGIARDSAGNIYVADGLNNAIRKVTATGTVSTLVGSNGAGGSSDGTLAAALMSYPSALLVAESGSNVDLWVCDGANATLRKIALSTGQVTTEVGSPPVFGHADGTAAEASFYTLAGLVTDRDGNIIAADGANHTLRKITRDGVVSTWIGKAEESGFDEGTGVNARLSQPLNVAKDSAGNIYVTAVDSNRIHRITPAGESSVYAGTDIFRGDTFADGPRLTAKFSAPTGIAVDSHDNVYVADLRNYLIRRIDHATGEVTTIAGYRDAPGFRDGFGDQARFFETYALAVDAQDNIWVSDGGNNAIRKISQQGDQWVVKTIAGGPITIEETPSEPGYADGKGNDARFARPKSILFDTDGNLLVADFGNSLIRKVTPDGVVTTLIGTHNQFGITTTQLPGVIFEPLGLAWLQPKQLAISYITGIITVDLP